MLDESKEYTYAKYLTWHFKERVELILGKIRKMSPPPSWKHQKISREVTMEFARYFKLHDCNVFYAPLDVVLPIASKKRDTTAVQPDICILCDDAKLDDPGIVGAPDLVVEILSPGNTKHDLDTKFMLYQEAKVPEYWVVNPMKRYVLNYTLLVDAYAGSKYFTEGENTVSRHFEGLKVSVSKIFDNV